MIVPAILRSAAALLLIFGPAADPAVVQEKIAYYAERYRVNYREMYRTVECESGFNPYIQSLHPDPKGPNGREDSWGLAQIHLPAHPEITREEALDPDFSLDFMAREFSLGRAGKWTCYNQLNK